MEYVNRLDNFDGPEIAKIAASEQVGCCGCCFLLLLLLLLRLLVLVVVVVVVASGYCYCSCALKLWIYGCEGAVNIPPCLTDDQGRLHTISRSSDPRPSSTPHCVVLFARATALPLARPSSRKGCASHGQKKTTRSQ